ncbi:MAG: pyruvate kinase [Eubacteriales bacterium]
MKEKSCYLRKTKIICTIGPATESEEMIRALVKSGMNVARLNFSHGDFEEHGKRIEIIRKVAKEMNTPVAILLDTKGPEVRIKTFANKKAELVQGSEFVLRVGDTPGDASGVCITYDGLYQEVEVGKDILIDDGLICLTVERIDGTDIVCKVINGGVLSNNKSINLPGIHLDLEYISEKDKNDILFGIEKNVDFIAASFCRTAFDVLEVRKLLENNNGKNIEIIAKIENGSGVDNIDEILKVSDGVMVARGDMGVEIDIVELPRIQKVIIKKCYSAGKKVITATQMLDSMVKNPRPTRAEATDVANAVYDGTSAIMLSGETAVGDYPIEAVSTMSRIAEKTEKNINYKKRFASLEPDFAVSVTSAISRATCSTADNLGASAIVTFTYSGRTARMVSSFRPDVLQIACTSNPTTYNQLALSWGVLPVMAEEQADTDGLFEQAVEKALSTGYVQHGDAVVITAGVPVGISGSTNILKVQVVGNMLVKGEGINDIAISGKVCVCKDEAEALENFENGDILVIPKTSNNIMNILKEASAIITEKKGVYSHAAIVGLTREIPVICGAENACDIITNGTTVTVDATRGIVYAGVIKAL